MMLRPAAKAAFPLLFLLASLAPAQTRNPPPIKMGLWQSESTMSMSGMPNMPMGSAMAPHKIVSQACLTPDTWQKDLQGARKHQQEMNCTVSNLHQSAQKITLDQACSPRDGMSTTMHLEMFIDSDTAMHGTMVIKMSGQNMPQAMEMKSNIASHFLGSDCGNIQPGKAKLVH